jgi:hypothetical protein
MALHCFMRLRACGYKSKRTTENLARLFDELGNKALSRRLGAIADGMPEAPGEDPMDALPLLYGTADAEASFARTGAAQLNVAPISAKTKSGSKKPH